MQQKTYYYFFTFGLFNLNYQVKKEGGFFFNLKKNYRFIKEIVESSTSQEREMDKHFGN